MDLFRVLIVEDEPLVSMLIGDIVHDTVPSVVIVKTSVKEAKAALCEPFHFALLDVDVTNGKTYGLARSLEEMQIAFVFVSGSVREHLPVELRKVPFISKPFSDLQIRDIVLRADSRRARMAGTPPRDTAAHTPA
jgi:CheY-like chemotaxis protein